MESVGAILKKNRESKKITLLDVSNDLRVSEKILRNIENNIFQYNTDTIFILGHLRSYCSFLELNHFELVSQFKKEHFPKNIKKNEIERPKFDFKLLFSNKSFSLFIFYLSKLIIHQENTQLFQIYLKIISQ